MEITKVCQQCKEEKPLDQYSKCSKFEDGKQKACKACNKLNNAKFRKTRPAYQHKYYQTEKGKENKLKALRKAWNSEGSGVYRIVNKANGWIYIGSTKQLSRRRLEWTSYLNNLELHRRYLSDQMFADVVKYGVDAFEWSILEKMEGTKKQITGREYQIIKLLKDAGVNLYNILGT